MSSPEPVSASPAPGSTPPAAPGKNRSMMIIIAVVVGIFAIFVGIAVIGIIAAIAIPSLLRARVAANEASAVGDVRSVVSAEMVYQSVGDGRYGSIRCLTEPSSCLAGYSGPAMLDKTMDAPTKTGYRRSLELSADRSTFAYVAVPMQEGQTGVRAFCGDSTGVVCATSGRRPDVVDGLCDHTDCNPL